MSCIYCPGTEFIRVSTRGCIVDFFLLQSKCCGCEFLCEILFAHLLTGSRQEKEIRAGSSSKPILISCPDWLVKNSHKDWIVNNHGLENIDSSLVFQKKKIARVSTVIGTKVFNFILYADDSFSTELIITSIYIIEHDVGP